MVGSAMAIDMAKNHEVTLTDMSEKVLERVLQKEPKLRIDKLDVCDTKALEKAISPADLVICAVPGFLGFATLKKIIEEMVQVCASWPKRPLTLSVTSPV